MCAFNMDHVAAHVRETWSYAGAEVRGATAYKIHVTVGPEFPVSDFCADMAATFDALVTMQHTTEVGITLVVALSAPPPHAPPLEFPWLFLVFVILVGLAVWRSEDVVRLLRSLVVALPSIK